MKGIILAGGSGSRLYPITRAVNKQLLPVYDKPMIFYPLSTLMLIGIREILLISSPDHIDSFRKLLGTGEEWGVSISYMIQKEPRGLPEAFILGQDFIGEDRVCLILGDNILYGHGLPDKLEEAVRSGVGANIFGYHVKDPENYGVANLSKDGRILSIEEKPVSSKSNLAIPGLYFYENDVVGFAKKLKPSKRGELEITDLNRSYLEQERLRLTLLGRGTVWLDMGTHDGLISASNYIQTIETRQGLKIGCPEEIAFRKGYISAEQLCALANALNKTEYGKYLETIWKESLGQ